MTQEFLQDAVVEDLQDLFKDYRLKNSLGVERAINIFPYDTPIREGDDEAVDQEAPPEPYIVVRTPGGNIQDETAPHVVEVILIACVCDRDKNRQGYADFWVWDRTFYDAPVADLRHIATLVGDGPWRCRA